MRSAPRILIVEDEIKVREFFEEVLGVDGYSITTVGTVCHALAELEGCEFELVVLDLSLPDGDGLEIIRQLHAETPHLPILAISGYMVGGLPEIAICAGAAGVLAKPTTARRLRASINQLLGGRVHHDMR